jgi:peptidoglycan/xylan/chitin deacetylase (PgdA/CDA1 family)
MAIGSLLNHSIRKLDEVCARVQVSVAERRGGLISLFLHNLFTDELEIERDLAYPQQRFTVAHLRQLIGYFQGAGHRFVTAEEVIAGLPAAGRYVLLSFDDGYYNNQRALPVLEQFQVPAVFYIPAQMVAEGRGFWWDALYRVRRQAGHDPVSIFSEITRRAVGRTEDIEQALIAEFGGISFQPVGETDRLFTAEELRRFAAHPLVRIGNHGCLHEHLTSYPADAAAERIGRAQSLLREMTGQTPVAIAYPYGSCDANIARAARAAGLKLGVTTVPRKEYVMELTDPDRRMLVSRFPVWGNASIAAQCRYLRGDLMLHARYRDFVDRWKRS